MSSNYFVNYYGEEKQIKKLKEESIELTESITEWENGEGTLDHIKEEMADVENLSMQLQEHWNDTKVYKIRLYKEKRQMARIKKEKKEKEVAKCLQ